MSKQRAKNREKRLRRRIFTDKAVIGLTEENKQLKNQLKMLQKAYHKHLEIMIILKNALKMLGYINLKDAEQAIEKAISFNLRPIEFCETEYRNIDLE